MEGTSMKQYHELIEHILENGIEVTDRTGVGTKSVFGYQMRFDLSKGFPAITTKKLAWKAVVAELMWMLEGSTDERRLAELTYGKSRDELVGKKTIWTANAEQQGVALGYYSDDYIKELGPVYGAQWRNFDYYSCSVSGVDQISNLIKQLKQSPDSRRMILSSWNPLLVEDQALPPCHLLFQLRVYDNILHSQLYVRSNDVMLGAPFNIAFYALLTHIFARHTGLQVGELVYTIGDAHIYLNHIEGAKTQLQRTEYPLPELNIHESFDLDVLLEKRTPLDIVSLFELKNYQHHPHIFFEMAV
jgi:thymidylate synthase